MRRQTLTAAFGLAPALALTLALAARGDDLPGVPDSGWDVAFTRSEGWTGADGAYSVALRDGRTLWLFSDTWIGPVRDGRHAAGSTLINNTVAVHATPRDGAAPEPGAVAFVWGREGERPAAWIVPDQAAVPGGGWYWLLDGHALPDGRLVVFLAHIGRREGAEGVFAFKGLGAALAIVDDPGGDPATWTPVQHAVPFAAPADDPARAETVWGNAVLLEGEALYVFGVRETGGIDKHLLLARAPARAPERFPEWRFWDGAAFVEEPARAAPVATGLANELSVERVQVGGRSLLVMVHSQVLTPRVATRTAARPEGPWSAPRPVFEAAGLRAARKDFAYAGKGHAHLSAPGELLVTYVVNAEDFEGMVADAAIYRPRFVRVPLSAIAGE